MEVAMVKLSDSRLGNNGVKNLARVGLDQVLGIFGGRAERLLNR